MPHPGQVLGDRYRLDDRIAAGGMGEVWRATDTVLGRDVAVKTLHTDRAGDPGFQTRFKHEARAMAVLHHPGVADVYDYGQTGSDAYIVMARVHGEALNQRIAAAGRLTPAETMSIVTQAGKALEAAHQAGIVHRDVKPGNLIIRGDGTVVLVDFGVARSAESAALTGAKEVVGTALYIAPEQVSKETTGPSADVYALGTVAYHCLAGHPPFVGDSAIAVAMQHVQDEAPPLPAEVPPAVRALVATAMAKDPTDRFPSAAAMSEAAHQALPPGGAGDETAILAATQARATVPGYGSPASAASAAGPGSHTGSGTAIFPAVVPDEEPHPTPPSGRRRALMLALAAVVLLGSVLAVLAVFNLDVLPGRNPAEATQPSVKPSAQVRSSAPRNRQDNTGQNTNRTTAPTRAATPTGGAAVPAPTTAPAGGGEPEPTTEPTTAPTQAEPTAADPTSDSGETGTTDGDGAAEAPTAAAG